MKSYKKLIFLTVLNLFFSIALDGCGSNRIDFESLVSQGDEVRVYEIFGMDCPGCHGGVENLIDKIPGVKASKANWEKQQLKVIITANAEVSDEDIFKAIKQANFTPGKRLK